MCGMRAVGFFIEQRRSGVDFKMGCDSWRNVQKAENTPGLQHETSLWGGSMRTALFQISISHDTLSPRHASRYPAIMSRPRHFSARCSQQRCQCLHTGCHQCIIWPVSLVYCTDSACFSAARSSSVLVYLTGSWSEQTSRTSTFTSFCATAANKGFIKKKKAVLSGGLQTFGIQVHAISYVFEYEKRITYSCSCTK